MVLPAFQVMRSGALIATLSVLAAGCYALETKGQAKEGQSHWLGVCLTQADCGSEQICACGVCTIACETGQGCGTGASCEPVAERAACEGAPSEARSVCLQSCTSSASCEGSGLSCVDDACVLKQPEQADRRSELADSSITVGADASEETTETPVAIALGPDAASEDGCEQAGGCGAPSELEVALLWIPHGLDERIASNLEPSGLCPDGLNEGYAGQVAQALDIEVSSLPIAVDVSTLDRPPPAALVPAPEGHTGGWSVGHLVLYRDGNGNGLLDPRNLAQDSPDEIVGTSADWALQFELTGGLTSHVIYYSDETLPEYWPVIQAGFNIFRDVADASGSGERSVVPLHTPIPIPERDGYKVQTMNCEELCFAQDEEFTCPATAAELPDDGILDCPYGSPAWRRTRCEGCSCFTASCVYTDEQCDA